MNICDCINYNQVILFAFISVVMLIILSGFLLKKYRRKQAKKKITEPLKVKKIDIALKGDIFELNKLSVILEDLERYGVPIKTIFELNIIIEEVFASIIHHQTPDSPDKRVLINLRIEKGKITANIKDWNEAFNPTLVPAVDLNAPLEEISFQGLGFHLVRKLADQVSYQRLNDQNILAIIKHFQPDEKA